MNYNIGKIIVTVVIPGLLVYLVYYFRYLCLDNVIEIFEFKRSINSYTWTGIGCFIGSLAACCMVSENDDLSGGDLIGIIGFTGVGLLIILFIDFLLTGGEILL
jgi:hypothetical protein